MSLNNADAGNSPALIYLLGSRVFVNFKLAMKAKKIVNTVALTILLLAGSAGAQTSTPATSTDEMPGTPNTGSGGHAAANMILLTGSAAVGLGGAAYLLRRRTQ